MLVVHLEAVIQLEAHAHTVVDALVAAAGDVLQTVTHEVWLHGFNRVLANRDGVTRKA